MKSLAGLLIAAALAFGSGCARTDWIERTLVTVDVTGVWHGSMNSWDGAPSINEEVSFELKQQGPNVSGYFRSRRAVGFARQTGPIGGSVAGDVFRFNETNGSVTGELTVSGDEMKGQITASGRPLAIFVRRVDSSPPTGSPTR
jgi:hypothetical protein